MTKGAATALVIAAGGLAYYLTRPKPASTSTYNPVWPQFDDLLTWDSPYTMTEPMTQAERNLKAFLSMIQWAEGTAQYSDPYRVLFGGELFNSFDDHPRKVICRRMGTGEICSSAAGAYQILQKTWDWIKEQGPTLEDFSPESQDEAAKRLIQYRGALADVEAGYFALAVSKVSKEWASMPKAGYGQPEKTLTQLQQIYTQQGGLIA